MSIRENLVKDIVVLQQAALAFNPDLAVGKVTEAIRALIDEAGEYVNEFESLEPSIEREKLMLDFERDIAIAAQ